MFDLPVDTPQERRQYRIFRKELFTMLQYSVYYRAVQNRAAGKRYETAIKSFLPVHGEVRLVSVSEKQFNDMQILVGSRSNQETIVGSKELVII